MTPQASFMAVAPITPGREDELRKLLASMNHRPGVADPDNPLVPFGRLAGVHFARFVILDDATLDDVTAHGVPRVDHRLSLAFLADFDGPVDAFLDDLLRIGGSGLQHVFAHCEAFAAGNVRRWLEPCGTWPASAVERSSLEHLVAGGLAVGRGVHGLPELRQRLVDAAPATILVAERTVFRDAVPGIERQRVGEGELGG